MFWESTAKSTLSKTSIYTPIIHAHYNTSRRWTNELEMSHILTHELIITSDMCVAVKSGALNMWIKICIASFLISSIFTKQIKNRGSVKCDENLSAKARRHFCSESSTIKTIVSTESVVDQNLAIETAVDSYITDDYDEYSFREPFFKPDEPVTHEVIVTTTPSNFMDDDAEPFCDDLMEGFDDMTNCKNRTKPETITRWRDTVFEKLIHQAWRDTQKQINQKQEYGGILLEPLVVKSFLPYHPTFNYSEETGAYSADLKMWDIQVHGLSTIFINNILVTRAQNLFDFDMKVQFKFDQLTINGTYDLTGIIGGAWFGSSFSSDGERPFKVDIINATITPQVKLDTTENKNLECLKVGDVLITDIGVPLKYDDISINFENLGYTYNTVINGISIFILKAQEKSFVTFVKDTIRQNINSLIC